MGTAPRFHFDFATKSASHKELFVHYVTIEQQVRDALLHVDGIRPEGNHNGLSISHEEFFPISTAAVRDANQVLCEIADHFESTSARIREQIR